MKVIIQMFIFVAFTAKLFAQIDVADSVKYRSAKEFFSTRYMKHNYGRFKGKIIIVDNQTIKYNEKVLIIPKMNDDYKAIFTTGIFYPNIITGDATAQTKSQQEIYKMTDDEKLFYDLTRSDSIVMGYFEEMKSLNPNPQTRRFIFWRFYKRMANPTECYFELQNSNATETTSFSEFLKNARVTFYTQGAIII